MGILLCFVLYAKIETTKSISLIQTASKIGLACTHQKCALHVGTEMTETSLSIKAVLQEYSLSV